MSTGTTNKIAACVLFVLTVVSLALGIANTWPEVASKYGFSSKPQPPPQQQAAPTPPAPPPIEKKHATRAPPKDEDLSVTDQLLMLFGHQPTRR